MTFGEFFKEKRLERKLSIREMCSLYGYDSGNISRLERSRLPPPRSQKKLDEYAKALGVKKGTADYERMMNIAYAENKISQLQNLLKLTNKTAGHRFSEFLDKLSGTILTEDKINRLIDAVAG